MKPLRVDAEAEAELIAAMAWYEQRREGLGIDFHSEVEVVLDQIRQAPSRGWKCDDEGHRVLPVDRFPYLIYYEETQDEVWVAAIAHQRRQPDYWQHRKPN